MISLPCEAIVGMRRVTLFLPILLLSKSIFELYIWNEESIFRISMHCHITINIKQDNMHAIILTHNTVTCFIHALFYSNIDYENIVINVWNMHQSLEIYKTCCQSPVLLVMLLLFIVTNLLLLFIMLLLFRVTIYNFCRFTIYNLLCY